MCTGGCNCACWPGCCTLSPCSSRSTACTTATRTSSPLLACACTQWSICTCQRAPALSGVCCSCRCSLFVCSSTHATCHVHVRPCPGPCCGRYFYAAILPELLFTISPFGLLWTGVYHMLAPGASHSGAVRAALFHGAEQNHGPAAFLVGVLPHPKDLSRSPCVMVCKCAARFAGVRRIIGVVCCSGWEDHFQSDPFHYMHHRLVVACSAFCIFAYHPPERTVYRGFIYPQPWVPSLIALPFSSSVAPAGP